MLLILPSLVITLQVFEIFEKEEMSNQSPHPTATELKKVWDELVHFAVVTMELFD